MKLRKKDLKRLEIEVDDTGFVVWVQEKVKSEFASSLQRHYLLDGSLFLKDGEIGLSNNDDWDIYPEYDNEKKIIRIKRKNK
jgi:hypothetical protein